MQLICVYLLEVSEHALGCNDEGYPTLHNRNALLSSFLSGKLRHRVQLHPSHRAVGSWHRRVETPKLSSWTQGPPPLPVCVDELLSLAGPSSISCDVSSIDLPSQAPPEGTEQMGWGTGNCCYINTLLTFVPVKDERERLSQGPPNHQSVFLKHAVINLHSLQTPTTFRVHNW